MPIFLLEVLTFLIVKALHVLKSLGTCIGGNHTKDSKRAAIWKPKREASEESNAAGTLILDFLGFQNFAEIWMECAKEQPTVLYYEMDSSAVDDAPVCQDQC